MSPAGFTRTPGEGVAELGWDGSRWRMAGQPLGGPAEGAVTAEDVARLRPLTALRVTWAGDGPLDVVGELAAAGVPLFATDVPDTVRRADQALAVLLESWDPAMHYPATAAEERVTEPDLERYTDPRAAPDTEPHRHSGPDRHTDLHADPDAEPGTSERAAGAPPPSATPGPAHSRPATPSPSGARASAGDGPVRSSRSVADLRREEHSIRLRRYALRARGGAAGSSGAGAPTVSVVMASMRPHLLSGALAQIARQRHVHVEVVLGLHGVPADHPEVRRAVAACELPLTIVEADAAVPFGEVLNRAAAEASGDLLAKWDDDDWYGPEHLADLLLARTYSGADIVGTTAEFFYLEPLRVTVRRTDYTAEIWSDHVAGGTILLDLAEFWEIGGFAALPSGVDAHFLKAAHGAGARIYRTHGLGYVLRRSLRGEHTWRLPLAHFLRVATNQWYGFRPSLLLETP